MDCSKKLHLFGLYASLKSGNASLLNEMVDEASDVTNHFPEAVWLSRVLALEEVAVAGLKTKPSLFDKANSHLSEDSNTAFIVAIIPHYPRLSVAEAAHRFNLTDLHPALGDYFVLKLSHTERRGQRRSAPHCPLPFSSIKVWNSFRIQQHSVQDDRSVLPSRTVQALPSSNDMPYGRCNTVLINDIHGGEQTSSSGNDRTHSPPSVSSIVLTVI